MVKTSAERTEKYDAKYDADALMLRVKALQNWSIDKFPIPAEQAFLIDDNLRNWLKEVELKYGQRGELFDFVRKIVWKWNRLTVEQKEILHDLWITKGLTEILWSKIEAKHNEITSFRKTYNAENIMVKYETDVFPYPIEQISPIIEDYVLNDEQIPLPIEVYVQNFWRQQGLSFGSVDYKYVWSEKRMDKTVPIQTSIETVEPLKIDKTVQLKAHIIDFLPMVNLAAYWNLNEGTGIIAYDDTPNHYDLDIFGASWTNGKLGKALSFNGAGDYVLSPQITGVGTGNASLCAWVKFGNQGVGEHIVIRWDTLGSPRSILGLFASSTYIRGELYDSTVGYKITANVVAGDNLWHFVVVVRNGDSLIFYLDKVAGTPISGCANFQLYNAEIVMGKYREAAVGYFAGVIDEPRLFKRALTQLEIEALYFLGTHFIPDKNVPLNATYKTESGTKKSVSQTKSISTKTSNQTLPISQPEIGINISYETEVV